MGVCKHVFLCLMHSLETNMASADVDLTEKIRMLNMNLKEEQKQAVKELQNGNDVLAVLPTRFGKSRIFNETNGRATIVAVTLDLLPKGSLGVMAWVGFSLGFDRLQVCGYTLINYPR